MNILVTGFEPNDDGLNASKILVETFRDEPPEELSEVREFIHYEVIPPSSNKLQATILEHISHYKPDYCVFIGQVPGRNKISFERLATNLKVTLPLFSVSLSCINLRRIVAAPRASFSRIASG